MASILLFALDSAWALYDLGCGRAIHGNAYFERFPFSWNTIGEWGGMVAVLHQGRMVCPADYSVDSIFQCSPYGRAIEEYSC